MSWRDEVVGGAVAVAGGAPGEIEGDGVDAVEAAGLAEGGVGDGDVVEELGAGGPWCGEACGEVLGGVAAEAVGGVGGGAGSVVASRVR